MDRINNALYHHMYFVPGGDRMEIIIPLACIARSKWEDSAALLVLRISGESNRQVKTAVQ